MKILSLSNCALDHDLGSGRTRLAWAEGLRRLGHEVASIDSVELMGGSEGEAKGRRVRIARGAWRWLQRCEVDRYDLIEFFGAEFWLATWRLSRREKRPLLVAHTDGLELLAEERLRASEAKTPAAGGGAKQFVRRLIDDAKRPLERLAFTRADGFVTASGADGDYLLRHGLRHPETMAVVPLGLEPAYLDLPWQNPRQEEVVYLGSWIDRKGTAPLTAAMTALLRERPGLRFSLYGTGGSNAAREAFPEPLRARVVVHPRRTIPEIIAGLSAARVFFFPSEYEGFGLALAEAMACGCAAVTTPTGFGAELAPGHEAMICPFGDTAAMERSLRQLLDDEPLRARVAGAGWRRAQGLRWENSVRQLEATYRRWVEGRAATGGTGQPSPALRSNPVERSHP